MVDTINGEFFQWTKSSGWVFPFMVSIIAFIVVFIWFTSTSRCDVPLAIGTFGWFSPFALLFAPSSPWFILVWTHPGVSPFGWRCRRCFHCQWICCAKSHFCLFNSSTEVAMDCNCCWTGSICGGSFWMGTGCGLNTLLLECFLCL